MWRNIGIIMFISLALAPSVLAYTPENMAGFVVGGMKDEGVTVKCSITPSNGKTGYDYHITHVKGMNSEEDFLFACMGTVAMNSALAEALIEDFKSNILYITYNSAIWKIEIPKLQSIWIVTENPNLNPEELMNIMDKLKAALVKLK